MLLMHLKMVASTLHLKKPVEGGCHVVGIGT